MVTVRTRVVLQVACGSRPRGGWCVVADTFVGATERAARAKARAGGWVLRGGAARCLWCARVAGGR